MVLRFNLRVRNAYKGLLLGTGPVIDPGYTGKIFIPLHNFTSNEYCIKTNAALIDVEFTKLSFNNAWKLEDAILVNMVKSLNFDTVPYIPKSFTSKRDTEKYDRYIEEALVGDPNFSKKDTVTPFVNSSLQEEINRINSPQKSTMEKIKEMSHLKTLLTVTICTVVFAGCTLFASTCIYFRNAREIPETRKKLEEQQSVIMQQNKDIDALEKRIQVLEVLENDKVKKGAQ